MGLELNAEETKMKKEIKRLGWLVVAAVLALTTVACSNDETVAKSESLNHAGKINMSVVVSKPADIESRALALDGMTLKDGWETGEELKVVVPVLSPDYNPAEDDMDNFIVRYDEIGTLTAERNGTTTTFSGTLSKKPDEDLPISLVYPKFPFDFRGQKGTLTDISANFDHAVGVLEKWTLDGDNITVPDTTEFMPMQAIIRFTLKDEDGNPINATSLKISGATGYGVIQYTDFTDENSTAGSITITPDAATSEIWAALWLESKDITLNATCSDGSTYSYTKNDVVFYAGNFYSVTVKMKKDVDLSKLTANYVAKDGDVLTGTLAGNYKVSIADGAKVTLRDVTINGANNSSCLWAGITCAGDAEITLVDDNTVIGFENRFPGIMISNGYTLTIKGNGSLTAKPSDVVNGGAPGIGGIGSYVTDVPSRSGNINIIGGTITATGGKNCPGIGGGANSGPHGWVNIANTVTKVTSTRGEYNYTGGGANEVHISIGHGAFGRCEKITVGKTVYWENSEFKNGGDTYLTANPFVYEPHRD